MMRKLTCQQCGGVMKKKTQSAGNCAGILLGLILIVGGIALFIMVPVVGWVLGPLVAIFGLFMGGKTQKVWRCVNCRAIVPRA